MATVGGLLEDALARLRSAGSESARLDAEVLLAFALGTDRTALVAHPERPVDGATAAHYDEAVRRRETGEPVAYIRGIKEFFGLAFSVDARALIPRPETERLVEHAVAETLARLTTGVAGRGGEPVRIVDVGTGSGAVAIAVAVELRRRRVIPGEDVTFVATDAAPDALGLARENAVGHAVADVIPFVEADLLPFADAGGSRFDVVLANLPYVRSDAIPTLPIAASFEPVGALDGGPDGLLVIRRLLERLPDALVPDGVALLEIGADQGDTATAAAAEILPGWSAEVARDLAGLPRVLRLGRGGPE
ncbi:MAG TPA: peptide chain release factor N(5)-glutamine methyltransferase [Candidatus Limnocylindrales bacterium]|nr:peptide chain release factor N(5)-glutamine methyltransferase [Candidatus Limnocylindrales bacterium]